MQLFGNSEQPLFDLLLFLRFNCGIFQKKKEQAVYEMDVGERVASACNYQLKSAPDCN